MYGIVRDGLICFFAVALGLAAPSLGPALADDRGKPVMVGGDADWDACGSSGVVANMKGVAGNFLAVRSGPGTGFAEVDRLSPAATVYLCAKDGDWWGVVYGTKGQDCGVASPIATRQPYTGPCSSGWVKGRYIEITAG